MKNILITFLAVVAIAEGYLLYSKTKSSKPQVMGSSTTTQKTPPGVPFLTKGMKLSDWPLKKFAYQVAPGVLSNDAKNALAGWNIKTEDQKDGSVLVTLTPKNSDDQRQQYTVRKGYMLYFVEQTPVDDKDTNTDTNLRDDYGVIVDSNGVVQ